MTALVTGSSSGIGYTTAIKLLENGYKVIGIARSSAEITHQNYTHYRFDLRKCQTQKPFLIQLVETHPDIDTLILNAGIGHFGSLEQLTGKQIAESIELNIASPITLTKILLPTLKKKTKAHIVFLGSEAALKGAKGSTIYSASKFALRGFALSLSKELQKTSVRVTLVHPGLTRTKFHEKTFFEPGPEKDHALQAIDIAESIIFILSTPCHVCIEEHQINPKKNVVSFKKTKI